MKPISFEESNKTLAKPASMTDTECSSLDIHNTEDGRCVSCWQGTWIDRLRFLFTGKMWLQVWSGHTQPPVYVGTEFPFVFDEPE